MNALMRRFVTAMIERDGGCIEWSGSRNKDGYGIFNHKAHRVAYELFIGEIPDGYQIDHLCRNRACVNPAHLEVVTPEENNRRSDNMGSRNARKTHCPQGHEYTPDNIYTWPGAKTRSRACRTCIRERAKHRRAA